MPESFQIQLKAFENIKDGIASTVKQKEKQDQADFENFKQERYDKIYSHELAHQRAGGHLAGGINIIKDSNGVATSGFVPIKLPGLNKANPEKTIQEAQIAFNAAMAPGDPSSQDYAVAAKAQGIMGQAKVALDKKS